LWGPASATIERTLVDHSDRAGVATFGARVSLGHSDLTCQAFDVDSEPFEDSVPKIDDAGGNLCGCPTAVETCLAVSAGLEPPPPVETAESGAK
jgi:hypothetical protein